MAHSVPYYSIPMSSTVNVAPTVSVVKGVAIATIITVVTISIIAVGIAVGVSVGTGSSIQIVNTTKISTVASPATTVTVTTTTITTVVVPGETTTSTLTFTSTTTTALTAASPTGTFSILPPPPISCTYDPAKCGCAATQPAFATPRIFQGYTARPNSWPWAVKILIAVSGTEYNCAGFLYTFKHVITAAHCIYAGTTPSSFTVIAAIQKVSESDTGQTRTVDTITVHPNYDHTTFLNDIVILTLTSPFTQTDTVSLCCTTTNTALPNIGDSVVITGWGYIKEGGPLSDDLLQAVVKVNAPSDNCNLQSAELQFCAGYNGTDVCQGDSGGAIMSVINNAWTCIGVVSNGPSCHQDTTYTRIASYQDFITKNTKT